MERLNPFREGLLFLIEPWMAPWGHNWERFYSLKQGDIYVEAGAFQMRYGREVARKVGSSGKVILIEPSPYNVEVMTRGIEVLGLTNVMLVQKAVWSKKAKMNFVMFEGGSANQLTNHSAEWERAYHAERNRPVEVIEVEADIVDNILADLGINHVDLFAADIEEAEIEMVKGMEQCLRDKKIQNFAIAHYHNYPKHYEILKETFQQYGYKKIDEDGGIIYGTLV